MPCFTGRFLKTGPAVAQAGVEIPWVVSRGGRIESPQGMDLKNSDLRGGRRAAALA